MVVIQNINELSYFCIRKHMLGYGSDIKNRSFLLTVMCEGYVKKKDKGLSHITYTLDLVDFLFSVDRHNNAQHALECTVHT